MLLAFLLLLTGLGVTMALGAREGTAGGWRFQCDVILYSNTQIRKSIQ